MAAARRSAKRSARKRHFTLEEANQRLPLVKAIVKDIVELYRDVHERRERLNRIRHSYQSSSRFTPNVYSEELDQIEEELDRDIERLDGYVKELRDLGVELKDPILGLVDFPTIIEGRRAYLCWKLGEPEVAYWHELDAGYAGRQSLLEGSMASDGAESDEDRSGP
ncbi:MAG TPA: DUF2203 family protein [Planctomycetaceae bacterium]|nr:DUF2203 family protein [Planctomycetaceae bacterium]